MKRWFLFALLAACVPATEEVAPRGGVIAQLVPTAETTGRPFRSDDGWTVTIDKFAVRAGLVAERPAAGNDFGGYIGGFGDPRIFVPTEACELRAVALSVGPAVAYVELLSRYSSSEQLDQESVCGVGPELLPYFERKADSVYASDEDPYAPQLRDAEGNRLPLPEFYNSPNLVVLAHAEKDGKRTRIEVAIDANTFRTSSTARQVPTTVVANQGAIVRIAVDAAALFRSTAGEKDSVSLSFDGITAADANGDGLVTGAELRAVKAQCSYDHDTGGAEDEDYAKCDSLLANIDSNAAYIFRSVR